MKIQNYDREKNYQGYREIGTFVGGWDCKMV